MNEIKPGDVFGEWVVLEKTNQRTKDRNVLYLCRCSCGTEKLVASSSLRQGKSKSCGHDRLKKMQGKRIENCKEERASYVGKKYGKLTVIGLSDKEDNFHHKFVKCQCDCGTVIETTVSKLRGGHTTSCGCIKSKGEEELSRILTNLQVSFAKEVRFTDCRDKKPLPFDFGIYFNKKLKGLIEYNGNIHYICTDGNIEEFERRKKHDRIKEEYCKKNKIPLLVIPYTEKDIESYLLTSKFWKQITTGFND